MSRNPTVRTATRRDIADAQRLVRFREEWKKRKAAGEIKEQACRHCGEMFMPERSWQSFCSNRCRTNAHLKTKMDELESVYRTKHELEEEVKKLKARIKELEEKV